jgi:hypothetical protein
MKKNFNSIARIIALQMIDIFDVDPFRPMLLNSKKYFVLPYLVELIYMLNNGNSIDRKSFNSLVFYARKYKII